MPKPKSNPHAPFPQAAQLPLGSLWSRVFPFVMGLCFALIFAKAGNPVIFAEQIETPHNFTEFRLSSWPIHWAYLTLGVALLCSLPGWRWRSNAPRWVLILPLVWLAWQSISAQTTVNGTLTRFTLLSFTACTLCFYTGFFAVSRLPTPWPIWCGLLAGLFFSLCSGFSQHFGGLEDTRHFVETAQQEGFPPELKAKLMSPEFQQKIASNRIFGTFVYPNAFAGGIILTLPVCLCFLWQISTRFPFILRGVIVGTVAYMGAACMYWSGSKAGWLISLGMILAALFHLRLATKAKAAILLCLLAAGLAAFYGKHSSYFAKKTNSTTARLDYWKAAWDLFKEKPLLGHGPGTFKIGYQRLKRPESESTRLAHNDYLQQGSDSGLVGMCSYVAFIVGSVAMLYRRLRPRRTSSPVASASETRVARQGNWIAFAIWLGVAGLAAQEFVEFSLYIPALAWPYFLFLGWLWGYPGD